MDSILDSLMAQSRNLAWVTGSTEAIISHVETRLAAAATSENPELMRKEILSVNEYLRTHLKNLDIVWRNRDNREASELIVK